MSRRTAVPESRWEPAGRIYLHGKIRNSFFGHVKCEMSFNILFEMLNRQMETEVRSVVQGRGRT